MPYAAVRALTAPSGPMAQCSLPGLPSRPPYLLWPQHQAWSGGACDSPVPAVTHWWTRACPQLSCLTDEPDPRSCHTPRCPHRRCGDRGAPQSGRAPGRVMRGREVDGLWPSLEETPQAWLQPRAPLGEDGGAAWQRPCCYHRHTL